MKLFKLLKRVKFRHQKGAFLMLCLYGGLFLLLFARFFYIQATGEVKGYSLEAIAAEKYARSEVLQAERGKILDRNENIIAEDTNSYRLQAIISKDADKHVEDPRATAQVLSQYIDLTEEEIYEILTPGPTAEGKPRYQVEFKAAGKSLTHETKLQIEAHDLPGIIFTTEKKRNYPNGKFASHLIGFAIQEEVEKNKFETIGKMGLEYTYNKELTGTDGKIDYKSDIFGYLLPNTDKMIQDAQHGYEIHLTLDKTIQSFLDDAMNRVEKEYNPESMVAVVADPKTGEILAMSQRPTFDPDDRLGLANNTWLNEVVEGAIEPGSTVKTFTIAAAIDSANWHPNAYYQSGKYVVGEDVIRDHHRDGWNQITYREGFLRSSNTMIANQLEIMGPDVMYDYFDKFGFGQKTGINLPDEATGKILTEGRVEAITTGYGQGSTFTPIQLVQAMTAIANEGKMMQPYVIDKIVNPNTGEVVKDYEPVVKGEPIKPETASQMLDLLSQVVNEDPGSGKNYRLEEYEVAGKTGTASISTGTGSYYSGTRYFYSFLGAVPADDPQLIVYVGVKYPKIKTYGEGSVPVSKVVNSVVENSLKYLNVNPENVDTVETTKLADFTGKNAIDVQASLQADGINAVVIGDGGMIQTQYPAANLTIVKDSVVFLKTEGEITLPSFDNWSLRNVLVYKTLSGLNIEVVGDGYVTEQSVSEGAIVNPGEPVVIKLMTPQQLYLTDPPEFPEEPEEILEYAE